MRIFTYVIEHDMGFAPNPFFGICSLAACKPLIRKAAALGDVIVGFGSAKYGLAGKVSYWMLVDEILTFDQYWHDERFRRKRPELLGSMMLRYGDNLYHTDPASGAWIQEPSFHSDPPCALNGGNLRRDTGTTERVLLGRDYAYWGGDAIPLPDELKAFETKGRGAKSLFSSDQCVAFLHWLSGMDDRGFKGEPADWKTDQRLKKRMGKAA
jgi:hypothetical protein